MAVMNNVVQFRGHYCSVTERPVPPGVEPLYVFIDTAVTVWAYLKTQNETRISDLLTNLISITMREGETLVEVRDAELIAALNPLLDDFETLEDWWQDDEDTSSEVNG